MYTGPIRHRVECHVCCVSVIACDKLNLNKNGVINKKSNSQTSIKVWKICFLILSNLANSIYKGNSSISCCLHFQHSVNWNNRLLICPNYELNVLNIKYIIFRINRQTQVLFTDRLASLLSIVFIFFVLHFNMKFKKL